MFESMEVAPARGGVLDAISALGDAIDRLQRLGDDTEFAALGPDALIEALRAFETQRNRLSAIDHVFIEAADMEQLWEHTTARSTAGALSQILHLPVGEANARVRAAKGLGARISLDGQELPPMLPTTARAQRQGLVNPTQASIIGKCVEEIAAAPSVSVTDVEQAESALVDYAAAFGPKELQRVATKITDVLIPDGTEPRDGLVNARRGLRIGPQRNDGSATISGVLTPEVRAQLWAVLSPMAAPRPAGKDQLDPRSGEQRMHDALGDACALLLRGDELPQSGGVPATVIITTTLDDIQRAAAHAGGDEPWESPKVSFTTADGMQLSIAQLLSIAGSANVIPAFLNSAGGVTAYGRSRRYATPGQISALIARDGGCSFPDCEAPPQWCEAHHVIPWIAGGATNLDNLTLVCGYHHRDFERRGWDCQMVDGMPHWIPPAWVDPARRPLRNRRLLEPDPGVPIPGPQREPLAERVERALAAARDMDTAIADAVDSAMAGAVDEAMASWVESALARFGATRSAPMRITGVTE